MLLGASLVAVTAAALVPFREEVGRAIPVLLLLLPVVVVGVLRGRLPALVTAVLAAAAFNVAFIPPYDTLKVDTLEDAVALAVFLVVAAVVGTLMAAEARRRQAAEARAAELATLHEELAAVQAEREQLADEATRVAVLERVDEQRTALLRSVSHDLRTPLATIRAVASDLRSDADYDPATRTELLDLVADEAERLDRLVANLLNLSRIEAGALAPDRQAVDVGELVAECVRRLDRLFARVRLQVEVPPGLPLVDADYSQLDQVVANLLENAARHAPPASTVRVGAAERGELVAVWVVDEGPGVPAFERRAVFEPFRRGEGSTSSGIGLAICKAVVEAHGGSITVGDAPGGGARFEFTVPVRR